MNLSDPLNALSYRDRGCESLYRALLWSELRLAAYLQTQIREKTTVAASSVAAAVFLTFVKFVIGLVTGSLGILAEAAHSGLDLAAAATTLFAVRVSDRPADESHPYGHGKVENLSALVETLMLLITCAWIIYEAIDRLFVHPQEVDPSIWAFLTMVISIAIDSWRSRALYRTARKYGSQALEADALHFRTDIWSSSVVILGLAFVKYGEFTGQKTFFVRADALAALAVAFIVTYVSLRLGRRAIGVLVDSAPRGLAEQVAAAAAQVEHVKRVTRVRVRRAGNQIFADLRVEMARHLSFEESHAVARAVRDAVHAISANADVVVHTVPTVESEGILERIQAVASRGHFSVHNITTHVTERGIWVDLDLEVDPDITFVRAHLLATDLETRLRERLGKIADINVHIEPRGAEPVKGMEIDQQERAKYVQRIAAIRQEIPRTHACDDIALQRLDGTIYLSLHLSVDRNLTIAEVHSIAEEMENRLRREFPKLGRVMIHVEPRT